jgi:hypothetical protein
MVRIPWPKASWGAQQEDGGKMSDTKKKLGTMFPGRVIAISEDEAVTVTPLKLKDLPKVIDAFASIMQKASAPDIDPQLLAIEGAKELLEMLPFCIDRPPEEIPLTVVPEILLEVVTQNLSEDSLGKWKALFAKVGGLLPAASLQAIQGAASKTSSQPT